jgi:uncharacterized membrane protein YdjX (TVP38/TMEM64 family)
MVTDAQPPQSPQQRRRPAWALIIVVILAAAVAFAALKPGVVRDSLLSVLRWTQGLSEQHRFVSALVIIGCYIVACMFFLPGSVLTIGTGTEHGTCTNNGTSAPTCATGASTPCSIFRRSSRAGSWRRPRRK